MKLELLSDLLRAEGLQVGVQEALRLEVVVRGVLEEGDAAWLPEHVAAVVVKDRDPAARAGCDRAVAAWLAALAPRAEERGQMSAGRQGPVAKPRWRRWAVLGAAGLLGAAGILGLASRGCRGPAPVAVPDGGAARDGGAGPDGGGTRVEVEAGVGVAHVTPRVAVLRVGGARVSWPGVGLAGLGLACGVGLFLALRRRSYLPAPDPWPVRGVPARVLPRGPAGAAARLLSRQDEDAVVFGVGHFVTDEPTRRLDMPRTVRATAGAAGVPALRFVRGRAQKEVWLWLDGSAASVDPGQAAELAALPEEVAGALTRAGLPVEKADYWGVPDRLRGPLGEFAPAEVDERREAAMVAVLTDGRVLLGRLRDERTRRALVGLLRQLAGWPHLCFVDLSRGAHGLGAALGRHGLRVIGPEEVASFFGGEARRRSRGGARGTAERAWAACCALSPFPVDEALAHGLREDLGLGRGQGIGAWGLREVRALARQAGERLEFGVAERAALLGWLQGVEPGLLLRAVGYLRWVMAQQAREEGTWEAAHLDLQGALLDLWDRPGEGVRRLYALHGGERDGEKGALREEVEAQLARLGPRECAGEAEVVALPWRFGERTDVERGMLREMGFAREARRWRPGGAAALRRPGRVYLGWGLCFGAGVAGLLAAWAVPKGPPLVREVGARPAGGEVKIDGAGAGARYRVEARRGGERAVVEVGAGGKVEVAWLAGQECPYLEEREPRVGMVFVRVCAGTFVMGSKEGDKEAYDDEKPAHRVRVGEFWIGKHEVSNEEYRRWRAGHQKEDQADWPSRKVNWEEARAYCQWLGGRLPTEAEWEYAARGADGRKYPWGNEAPDGERAVFFYLQKEPGLESVTSHPTGTGPFGTLHQAGNVDEWVQDCHEPYKAGQELDHLVIDKPGCERVLRGGSFLDEPRSLRSAVRFRYPPMDRNGGSGFRCVRAAEVRGVFAKPVPVLTREILRATILRAEPDLLACVHEGWGTDATLGLVVSPSGQVRRAEVVGALSGTRTGRCIEGKLRELRFPPSQQGADKQVFWPFHLPEP